MNVKSATKREGEMLLAHSVSVCLWQDALEPHMSRETLDYHWGKHHKTYVENLNKQILGTDLDGLSLEEVVLLSYNRGNMLPVFNNAAQVNNAIYRFYPFLTKGIGCELRYI